MMMMLMMIIVICWLALKLYCAILVSRIYMIKIIEHSTTCVGHQTENSRKSLHIHSCKWLFCMSHILFCCVQQMNSQSVFLEVTCYIWWCYLLVSKEARCLLQSSADCQLQLDAWWPSWTLERNDHDSLWPCCHYKTLGSWEEGQ